LQGKKLKETAPGKSLVNVLGVVYVHRKTSDGGDIYLTRFAEKYQEHLEIRNWHEPGWFKENRIRLKGTSAVYRVPTREIDGTNLDLVVKNNRFGEDVPLDTHALREFCDAEFNSPWEEFSLVTEMRDGVYGPKDKKINTQHPLAIYVPPERMQPWQSGRSRSKINRIRARHPGIDLDILKQYKLIYGWIMGKNLLEVFEQIDIGTFQIVDRLKTINHKVIGDMNSKGYLMADMKPEHVIISEEDSGHIEEIDRTERPDAPEKKADTVMRLIDEGRYSVIDYELVFRTPEHEDEVKYSRRHSYLEDQKKRYEPTPLPSHLSFSEIFGIPYIYGHAESTGGHLWVVGRNARLFDYFLPERWRKTPSLSLSGTNEVFYTVTKDNIHLVWKTSRVGEFPYGLYDEDEAGKIRRHGINSPFEEFAIAHELNRLGIPSVYVRAIYMTGTNKVEPSRDLRKYELHKNLFDVDGTAILQENHNYITIRGYYNGPDEWVPEHEDALYTPFDLLKARRKGIIGQSQSEGLLEKTVARLRDAGYDGSLLRPNDLLVVLNSKGEIIKDSSGAPEAIVCDFELIWKTPENA
jgi:hypothetical protein